jgi:hypothetical protein
MCKDTEHGEIHVCECCGDIWSVGDKFLLYIEDDKKKCVDFRYYFKFLDIEQSICDYCFKKAFGFEPFGELPETFEEDMKFVIDNPKGNNPKFCTACYKFMPLQFI